jgi:tetratricopeptide (TPR) repeat protein
MIRAAMSETKAIISSTVLDLPHHRQAVLDACLRQNHYPLMMEHLPAGSVATQVSLRMVDEASVYIGILGHRYGYIPPDSTLSITEMEYRRAVERGIPRLLFLMHDDHLIRVTDIEQGESSQKLLDLKKRIQTTEVVNYFKSAEELRSQVINSLSHYRKPRPDGFHFISEIPEPPTPYIAHPYILLNPQGLVGRQAELNLLTDWVSREETQIYQARVLTLVAIGGMGKSALTWSWFNRIVPQEMKPLAGRLWWSFYESDATFENFVLRALCYFRSAHRDEVQRIPAPEREDLLLAALDQHPYLVVLDGLERNMVAYARMDAASMSDDDLDERSGNVIPQDIGLPESAAESFIGRHRLRKAIDPRAGNFLRKLTQVQKARILISTRLYPAEFQTEAGWQLPGSKAVLLDGLTDDDALSLWRSFGVSGSRELLLRLFHSFGNYPLLIRALAGEVASFRHAPGDLEQWLEANPDFNPFDLPLIQRKSHVLTFALRGLHPEARNVLLTLAAFRMPATYDALVSLLVGPARPFAAENALDISLTNLEDRGLVGWDRSSNRYDLHPVVRGVAWHGLGTVGRRIIYESLQSYFQSLPALEAAATSLDDLTPAVELYHTLIGLGIFDEAYLIYQNHLRKPVFELCLARQSTEWLEMLFPDGIEKPPRLSSREMQITATGHLAYGYHYSGRLAPAALLFSRLVRPEDATPGHSKYWGDLAAPLSRIGRLREAELAARKALLLEPTKPLRWVKVGELLGLRGILDISAALLSHALDLYNALDEPNEFWEYAHVQAAQHALWTGRTEEAEVLANRAWDLANRRRFERNIVDAAAMQGSIALQKKNYPRSLERLQFALTKARRIHYVTAEVALMNSLAELYRVYGEPSRACDVLEDLWELLDRGPYYLGRATALNILAEIKRDKGHRASAVEAASSAYHLAWCDGLPYADIWQLRKAEALLVSLDEQTPAGLTLCRESDHEPMPVIYLEDLTRV